MPINVENISAGQMVKVLKTEESHFADVKAIEIAPAKLTQVIAAFANADGGDLYIGIDELADGGRAWRGFANPEAANGHIQAFEGLFPLGQHFDYVFLAAESAPGLILKVEVDKTPDIKKASDGHIYVRRSAQKLRLTTQEDIRRLELAKGIASFETEIVPADPTLITNSTEVINFMLEVVPSAEPETWLKKQGLIRDGKPTVCGILLFAEEPQAIIPKRCGLKIHRYKTSKDPSRETMAFTPQTVEGAAYAQIVQSVEATKAVLREAFTLGEAGLEPFAYPPEALHEIITNAVVHRDYSIADDIHIRVFDNRIEVESPGRLPAHVTPENILDERFARNGNLVRLLNKYPNPPNNKDVGEGLNTAFSAMRKLGLKEPRIEDRPNSVLVTLRHEQLASHEEIILEYLEHNDTIRNRDARELCHVEADYVMRRIFARLEKRDLIKKIPGTIQAKTAYTKGPKFSQWRAALKSGSGDDPAE